MSSHLAPMAPDVAAVFARFPDAPRARLLDLRRLIFAAAAATDGVGPIEEALRWGEPAYLTSQSGTGSTIRLAWKPSAPDQCSLLVNCRTSLVETFRMLYPALRFEGSRAIVLDAEGPLPEEALAGCITLALTYHVRKPVLIA